MRPKDERPGGGFHGKGIDVRPGAKLHVCRRKKRSGGIEEGGGGDRVANTFKKGFDGEGVASEKRCHPLRAGKILIGASIVDGAGNDEGYAFRILGLDGCHG